MLFIFSCESSCIKGDRNRFGLGVNVVKRYLILVVLMLACSFFGVSKVLSGGVLIYSSPQMSFSDIAKALGVTKLSTPTYHLGGSGYVAVSTDFPMFYMVVGGEGFFNAGMETNQLVVAGVGGIGSLGIMFKFGNLGLIGTAGVGAAFFEVKQNLDGLPILDAQKSGFIYGIGAELFFNITDQIQAGVGMRGYGWINAGGWTTPFGEEVEVLSECDPMEGLSNNYYIVLRFGDFR